MTPEDVLEQVAVSFFRAAASAGGDAVVAWLRDAATASPEHRISQRVLEILPAESESALAARRLRGG